MERAVWVFAQAEMWIFLEDSNGNLLNSDGSTPATGTFPDAALSYCYLQNATLTANATFTQRSVTGRKARRLVKRSGCYDDVTLQIGHLAFRKALEFNTNTVFNVDKKLRLALRFFELTYSNAPPFENDIYELTAGKAVTFNLSGNESAEVEGTASFRAERLLDAADNNHIPEQSFI